MNRGFGGLGELLAALAGAEGGRLPRLPGEPAPGLSLSDVFGLPPDVVETEEVDRVYVVRVIEEETWKVVAQTEERLGDEDIASQHPYVRNLGRVIQNLSDETKYLLVQIVEIDDNEKGTNPLIVSSSPAMLFPLTADEKDELKFKQLNELIPGMGDMARQAKLVQQQQEAVAKGAEVLPGGHVDANGDGKCDYCGEQVDPGSASTILETYGDEFVTKGEIDATTGKVTEHFPNGEPVIVEEDIDTTPSETAALDANDFDQRRDSDNGRTTYGGSYGERW
jgi:hypothetical protein